MDSKKIKLLVRKFKEFFPFSSDFKIVRAPGRVNLIGEHTDYNDGFVLPCAVNKDILAIGSKRKDKKVILYSLNFENKVEFNLDKIKPDVSDPWGNYPKGIFSEIKKQYSLKHGVNCLFYGDVPLASGMSSSAAVQVATLMLIDALFGFGIEKVDIAKIAQLASWNFVGVRCGIMDQFISCLGEKDSALFLDCRDLSYEVIPLNFKDINIIVCDTKVKRELCNSEYNLRREQCEEAAKILNVKSLRDAKIADLKKAKYKLPQVLFKRAKHVICENKRVEKSVKLLKEKKLNEFGKLLYRSHYSLKNDYEVSCFELDTMVNIAKSINGVLGARLMGAGFGGCTVNLVRKDIANKFEKIIKEEYFKRTKIKPDVYICKVTKGAEVLNICK